MSFLRLISVNICLTHQATRLRMDTRKDMNDAERFGLAVSQITGKRLTYAELTGKVGEKPAVN
jgi:hypothetical protein